MSDDDHDFNALVRMLSRYLRDNPQASDTPDGIASWWLQLNWFRYQNLICAALAWLVRAGLVEDVRSPDGRVRYRRVQTDDAFAALAELADGSIDPDPQNGDATPLH